MLYTQKLHEELARKRDSLAGYQDRYGRQLGAYREALRGLGGRYATASEITAVQDALLASQEGTVSVGARPTVEYDTWRASGSGLPVVPFARSFAHHEESRAWAEVLRGVRTLAVDGSQLPPWRDASVPVALVQAGIFENPHQPPAPYRKDVVMELLSPDDLLVAEADTADARTGEALTYSTQVVNLRRFELEVRTLEERLRALAETTHAPGERPRTVAFYDGSLIVSFALTMAPPYRQRYVAAACRLLQASAACRVPVVAYIDTSYARDVVTMLGSLGPRDALPETRGVHDALLWQGSMAWGDRTPAFISARDDLGRMGYGQQQDQVAFVYFQAALDRPPARLEFPRWVLEAGLLNDVLDVVRAEVIAGTGYPYPIEAADAVAVISAQDRAQFYGMFQEFSAREGLSFTFSRKALSKNRRRT